MRRSHSATGVGQVSRKMSAPKITKAGIEWDKPGNAFKYGRDRELAEVMEKDRVIGQSDLILYIVK